MEPFQLVCQSCAAKLKVKNRSAIGQRLACPRCREMIVVKAPEGHDIGQSETSPSSFEDMDMDSILDNQAVAPRPKSQRTNAKTPRPARSKQQTRPTAEIILDPPKRRPAPAKPEAKSASELAPTDDWVNPATKKKQRLVMVLMASVGGLLVLAAVGFAAMTMMGGDETPNDKIASNESSEVVGPEMGQQSEPVEEPAGRKVVNDSVEVPDDIPDVAIGDAPEVELPEAPGESAPPELAVSDTPPAIVADPSTSNDGKVLDNGSSEPAPPSEVGSSDSGSSGNASSINDTDMDKLKSILANSGTSLLEIKGAASSVRGEDAIGTPKYYFEKSPPAKLDINRQKDLKLLGVSYDQLPLQTALHELSAISGLALSIDVPTIAAADMPLNPPVTIEVEGVTTASVIRSVAQSVGLSAIETETGFWISTSGDNPSIKKSFPVADFVKGEPEEEAFVNLVARSVYPGTWKDASIPDLPDADVSNMGTMQISDGELTVEHSTAVVREVEKLVAAVRQAMAGQFDSPLFQPVPSLVNGGFSSKYNGQNSVRIPMSKLIQDFAANYDTTLIVDWQSLGKASWTPSSMAPGWIKEETVGDAIKESAHGMGASVYLSGDKTAWITSSDIASNIFEVKLYKVGRLAGGKLNQRRLEQIFQNALGSQLQRPGVSVSLFAGQEIAVVRAPQSLHRQIEAVVSALSK